MRRFKNIDLFRQRVKGVLLAGGAGTRLMPLTYKTNKHLLPVDDKPMIAYPLNTLAQAGVTEVYVIAGGNHLGDIMETLGEGNGKNRILEKLYGIREPLKLAYRVQEDLELPDGTKKPGGIAQAIGLLEGFINDSIVVMLGDNFFQNTHVLRDAVRDFKGGAHIFLKDIPEDQLYQDLKGERRAKYGIAELDGDRVVSIEEKPVKPKSRYAVTGAYIYDKTIFDIVKTLKPSWRGEYEISEANDRYVREGKMRATIVRGGWLDPGDSTDGLHEATAIVRAWKALSDKAGDDIPF